ncbi:MAG: hypothetical protein VX874_11435 [Pseudomonadota bacterium]|nr:hypothetical protein [Pseudomonadota bacterium]
MEPESFTWKPALLAKHDTLTIDGSLVRLAGDWTLDLAEVEDAAFVNQVMKGNRMVRLDLYTADKRRSIGYNASARAYNRDPDARTHLAACAATLRKLESLHPDQMIALGVIRGGRWGMFIIGLGTLIFGAILAISMLATGVSGDRLATAAIPTLVLFAMGGTLTYGHWPWRKRPRVKPTALAKTLDDLHADPAPTS